MWQMPRWFRSPLPMTRLEALHALLGTTTIDRVYPKGQVVSREVVEAEQKAAADRQTLVNARRLSRKLAKARTRQTLRIVRRA